MTHRWVTQFRAAVAWIARAELQPFLVVAAACLLIGERYPFSDFPMYSSFSDSTYYVYLADDSAQPLSTYAAIGVSTATLKKMYESALRAEVRQLRIKRKELSDEQRQAFGARFLSDLRTSRLTNNATPDVRTWRLYEVQIRRTDGQLQKETRLIAEQR